MVFPMPKYALGRGGSGGWGVQGAGPQHGEACRPQQPRSPATLQKACACQAAAGCCLGVGGLMGTSWPHSKAQERV